MSDHCQIHRRIHFHTAGRQKVLSTEETGQCQPKDRLPRVARLMALAIRLQGLVDTGQVSNYAELAQLAHVSRARVTQLANLTLLAPDIQEALLFLPPVTKGPDPITERDLRPVAAEPSWSRQRRLWAELVGDA